MKKKSLVIVGAVVMIAVFAAVLIFVLNGQVGQSENSISLSGTWLVFQHGDALPRDEFLVFSDSNVSYYRSDDSDPSITSTYSIDNTTLSATDIDTAFNIRAISENHVELTETNTIVWQLLLVGDASADRGAVIPQSIEGIYNVNIVGEERREEETMTFTATHLSFVQKGSEAISSDYTLTSDGVLRLMDINRDYYVYANGNNFFFIGTDDNGVWELAKAG